MVAMIIGEEIFIFVVGVVCCVLIWFQSLKECVVWKSGNGKVVIMKHQCP